jgi:hypothetical protein
MARPALKGDSPLAARQTGLASLGFWAVAFDIHRARIMFVIPLGVGKPPLSDRIPDDVAAILEAELLHRTSLEGFY